MPTDERMLRPRHKQRTAPRPEPPALTQLQKAKTTDGFKVPGDETMWRVYSYVADKVYASPDQDDERAATFTEETLAGATFYNFTPVQP